MSDSKKTDPPKPAPQSPAVATAKTVPPGEAKPGPDAPPNPPDRAAEDRLKARVAELEAELIAERERRHLAEAEPVAASASPRPRARKPAGVPVFGYGANVWEGHLPKDPTAPRIKFRTETGSAAEAKEHYLRHAGIVSTPHPVSVSRVHAE